MSRASATITLADGTVLFGLYNGTVDHMFHNLFLTEEERDDFWGKCYERAIYKTCGCEGEPCVVHHTYAAGRSWDGKACREHMMFLGPTDPDAWMYEEDRWQF